MEARISASLGLPSPAPSSSYYRAALADFNSVFNHFESLLDRPPTDPKSHDKTKIDVLVPNLCTFSTTSMSSDLSQKRLLRPRRTPPPAKSLSLLDRALVGASAGGLAGAFTYVCLHPLDTVKTKLQARGAADVYADAWDAVAKTFRSHGILGFYSGVSAVAVGSTVSSAVYFGTCEFGKSLLSKLPRFPAVLVPPAAGAMGNIASSAIMVPKELITQQMQVGAATGRAWEVLVRIVERDGVLGLYAGYSATLLRNLPAGVLNYSSFEYLKSAVLRRTKKGHLEPFQSMCCGALAGAISATITTPLDVVKTRLMTQAHGQAMDKAAAAMYSGVSATVRLILKEEGWVGLSRGIGPRVLHSACFSALGYFAFETARLMILCLYLKPKEMGGEEAVAPA